MTATIFTCKRCGDETYNPELLCRECRIDRDLKAMLCSGCDRMRYRSEPPFGELGAWLWGDPCACPEPRPPTSLEVEEQGSDDAGMVPG